MLRLSKKIQNEIFPVTFDDFEEGEGVGGAQRGRVTRSKAISGF